MSVMRRRSSRRARYSDPTGQQATRFDSDAFCALLDEVMSERDARLLKAKWGLVDGIRRTRWERADTERVSQTTIERLTDRAEERFMVALHKLAEHRPGAVRDIFGDVPLVGDLGEHERICSRCGRTFQLNPRQRRGRPRKYCPDAKECKEAASAADLSRLKTARSMEP